jgi:hypothetical protein
MTEHPGSLWFVLVVCAAIPQACIMHSAKENENRIYYSLTDAICLFPLEPAVESGSQVQHEFAELDQISVHFSLLIANEAHRYQPTLSFADCMRRSLGWLLLAGYLVLP